MWLRTKAVVYLCPVDRNVRGIALISLQLHGFLVYFDLHEIL